MQACTFPCFVLMSRTDQSRGSGSKQLQYKLRLTIKKSFVAERIAEPRNRLPGRKMPLFKVIKKSLDKNPSSMTQVIVFLC